MFEPERMFEGVLNIKYLTSGIIFKNTKQEQTNITYNKKLDYYRLSSGFKEAHNAFKEKGKLTN